MRAFLGRLKKSDEFFEGFLVLRGSICFIYEIFLRGDRVPLRLPFVTKNDKIPQNVLATSTSQTDATDPSTTVATITAATLMLQL